MKRREFIAGIGGAAAWPLGAGAQPRDPVKRIASIAAMGGVADVPFLQEFARLGWVEGRNVRIETLFEKDNRIIRAAAPFIVGTAPDLIVAFSTETVEIFKGLSKALPDPLKDEVIE
jgi:putative tryptophan/tyrosine transport system substrate-binding protein